MRELLATSRMVKDTLCAALSSSGPVKRDYEEIVKLINTLQTNAGVLHHQKVNGIKKLQIEANNISETKKYLARCGISLDRLDTLSVIHVAGTKGKGSTCALCESILRHHGFKTGFYSSPHLVNMRERIRINGRPLSKQDFSLYAEEIFTQLQSKKDNDDDMPPYFKFLTVVAFNAFLAEQVDVAIVEVGIGGEYDCTNVLRKVQVVGITSLGVDHVSLLGNTIQEIAWQKAGIMKPGSVAFTADNQPPEAMSVLRSRSVEKSCPLVVSPPLHDYDWGSFTPVIGIGSDVQKYNASLALQLANYWIKTHTLIQDVSETVNEKGETFEITTLMARGLKYCQWPGRTQTLRRGKISYFVDGAHTSESMEVCTKWFKQATTSNDKFPVKKALIFNATGDRSSAQLLELLFTLHFDLVMFCPNIALASNRSAGLQVNQNLKNFMVTDEQQKQRCEKHARIWLKMQERFESNTPTNSPKVLSTVAEALELVAAENRPIDVLVTGSLHLVGAFLSIVDPDLAEMTHQPATPQASESKII